MAQLVARFHGMEEVRGSNPLSSTVRTQTASPIGEAVSLLRPLPTESYVLTCMYATDC